MDCMLIIVILLPNLPKFGHYGGNFTHKSSYWFLSHFSNITVNWWKWYFVFFQTEEDIDNITEVTNVMLLNLTGLYSEHTKDMKQLQIYQHMGYCLWNLLDLLLMCKKEHLSLQKFIFNILRTCCSIVRNVTINVYCAWAEVSFCILGNNIVVIHFHY